MDFPTIIEIKQAIPLYCFKPNLKLSLFYAIRSILISLSLGVSLFISRHFTHSWLINTVYIYFQGLIFWGFFTIGHDCGHGAFSNYPKINWIIGNIFHSFILTPYEPWRLSHRSHHKNTGNLEKEEIFYPNSNLTYIVPTTGLGVGWFAYIILKNVPGRRNYLAYFSSEFASYIDTLLVSFLSIGMVLYGIITAIYRVGINIVMLYYGAPIFVFASWLVIVTFLHHNDEKCPWYSNEKWDIVKGSLSSVDRDYGWLVNNLSHNINLHQIHHLFPIIPHYYLNIATIAFREKFPQLSRVCYESIIVSFIKNVYNWVTIKAITDSNGVFVYNKNM